jgi:hypothetical protein
VSISRRCSAEGTDMITEHSITRSEFEPGAPDMNLAWQTESFVYCSCYSRKYIFLNIATAGYMLLNNHTIAFWKLKQRTVKYTKKLPGFESASELYRSSDRRRSAKLVPTLADRGCHVLCATSPSDRNFDFLDLEPLLFLPSNSSNCSRG